jgi:hypothetical protein
MLIRYYGHVGVPSGYGDAGAEMCMAIHGLGHGEIDLEISTDGKQLHNRYLPLASCLRNESELSPPDVVIVHTLPMQCRTFLAKTQIRERFPSATCVAYTTWEGWSGMPPEMAADLAAFDQVWVPSSATARRTHAGQARVVVVPHAFDDESTVGRESPRPRPDTYRFYYIGAWNSRKNVEGVIRAYARAFDKGDDVELLIQSAQAAPSACRIAQLATGIDPDKMPVVRFSNRRMSDEQIQAVHDEAHCFVTAARGESWNIPAFDALLAGNHVISPAGLGSDDFLQRTSAALYDFTETPGFGDVRLIEDPSAPAGYARAQYVATQGLSARSLWLEPNLIELANAMRFAYLNRITDLRIDYDPAELFGRGAVGLRILDVLQGAAT